VSKVHEAIGVLDKALTNSARGKLLGKSLCQFFELEATLSEEEGAMWRRSDRCPAMCTDYRPGLIAHNALFGKSHSDPVRQV